MRGDAWWAFIEGACPGPDPGFVQGLRAVGLGIVRIFVSLDRARVAGDKSACYLMGALFVFLFGRAKRSEHERLYRLRRHRIAISQHQVQAPRGRKK